MRTTPLTILSLSALTTLTTAVSIYNIPKCAQQCFATAVASSSCELGDSYCQCTTGAAQIREDTTSCLCTSTCSTADLLKAQQVSNGICSSAVSASGETYSATTVGLDVCQATGGAGSGSGSGTTTATSTKASATGASSGSGSSSASASASASSSASVESQSGNAAAPAVTGGVGAVMGVIGLGLMAL